MSFILHSRGNPLKMKPKNWRCFSIIGPTRCTVCFQFIVINSLYILQALICSSSGGTVYTAIGVYIRVYVFLCVLCRMVGSRVGVEHNTHKFIPSVLYTVLPDDEQISARSMYRLLIVINWKQTVQLVGLIILKHRQFLDFNLSGLPLRCRMNDILLNTRKKIS
jgi:hypothetical protein